MIENTDILNYTIINQSTIEKKKRGRKPKNKLNNNLLGEEQNNEKNTIRFVVDDINTYRLRKMRLE